MDRLDCDRMFVAVMETGSFAAAARRLGTSAGQASKMVARLETDLGVRLLNRTTRALAATEAGQAYHDRIRVVLDELAEIDAAIRSEAQSPRGRIRMTAPLSFGTLQLAPALTDFARRYPDIALDVQFSDRVVSLVDEGFDLALRVGQPVDSSLIARRLCDIRLRIVAAPAYLAAAGAPEVPQDLARHACILDTNLRDPRLWPFRQNGTEIQVAVEGRLRFSNAEACLSAAETGLGITLLPDFVAARSLAAGRVQAVLGAFEAAPYGVFAMYPPGRHLAVKVRVLVDFLAQRFHGAPDWI